MSKSEVFNIDCNEYMKTVPDKFFSLAIVDPPYRDAIDNVPIRGMRNKKGLKMNEWQNKPNKNYFSELFRVSKNQIIWGANNFIEYLYSTNCFIFWDKVQCLDTFSDGELAWTSFDNIAKKFEYVWSGNRYGKKDNIKGVGMPTIRIHPTEKPVQLYKWLLRNYAKEGDTILDTHLGSQSSRIACYEGGFDFWGCELDKDYFDAGNKRFENYKLQLKLF